MVAGGIITFLVDSTVGVYLLSPARRDMCVDCSRIVSGFLL